AFDKLLQQRHCHAAGAAPGRPEVDNNDLPAQAGERNDVALEVGELPSWSRNVHGIVDGQGADRVSIGEHAGEPSLALVIGSDLESSNQLREIGQLPHRSKRLITLKAAIVAIALIGSG